MTKYYDDKGKRVPAARTQRSLPETYATVMLVVSIIAILLGTYAWLERYRISKRVSELEAKAEVSKKDERDPLRTHDSFAYTYTHDGDIIRVYVITDPDRGTEYLVSDHGGMCPRDADE